MKKWTLITLMISVAIIFVCTSLPGFLWDMTSQSSEKRQSVTLDLPNVEKIISSSVDSNAVPKYFPLPSTSESLPDVEYRLEPSTDASESAKQRIAAFSNLVKNAVSVYFSIPCSSSTIALHTDLWNVYMEGHSEIVDIYCSTTLVLQQGNILWTVTAYGSSTALTYLNRTPYSSSDYLLQPIDGDYEYVLSDSTASSEILSIIFSDFLLNSHYFNPQIFKDDYVILNSGTILEEDSSMQRSYTVSFRPENYTTEFQIIIHMYQIKQIQVYRIMSIAQVK